MSIKSTGTSLTGLVKMQSGGSGINKIILMSTYSELLKDPLWQNKRKRIIFRDGNKCTVCNATKNLKVHHTFYYTDYREPWRYPDESLLTVCKSCHEKYHSENELTFKEPPKFVIKKK